MCVTGALFAGCSVTYGGSHADQRGLISFLFGFFDSPVDGGNIVSIGNFLHLPAVCFETLFNIFCAGKRRGTGQRYSVIIIKYD